MEWVTELLSKITSYIFLLVSVVPLPLLAILIDGIGLLVIIAIYRAVKP